MTKPPKWPALNNDEMLRWLAEQIDDQLIAERSAAAKLSARQFAVARARQGDPSMLRKMFPDFADCISAPRLSRGQHFEPSKKMNMLDLTVDIEQRIQSLWRQHYPNKQPRKTRGRWSAEEFAARLLGLKPFEEDEFKDRKKARQTKHGRQKRKSARP